MLSPQAVTALVFQRVRRSVVSEGLLMRVGIEMMDDWGHGHMQGGGAFMGITSLVIFVLLGVLVVWAIRTFAGGHAHHGKESAIDILDHRFARGEIAHDDYVRDREALRNALKK